MKLDFVPLLRVQRDLYRIPRGMERFKAYLRTMFPNGRELELPPLVIMNPMGKEHVATLLDALLVLDAEGVAARAVAEAAPNGRKGGPKRCLQESARNEIKAKASRKRSKKSFAGSHHSSKNS